VPRSFGSDSEGRGIDSTGVRYTGAAPYSVAGVTQVNFVVPKGSGTVPVYVSAGHTVSTQSGVWITVQ